MITIIPVAESNGRPCLELVIFEETTGNITEIVMTGKRRFFLILQLKNCIHPLLLQSLLVRKGLHAVLRRDIERKSTILPGRCHHGITDLQNGVTDLSFKTVSIILYIEQGIDPVVSIQNVAAVV